MTLVKDEDERGPKLKLVGTWGPEETAELNRSRIRRLEVNRAKGFRGETLDFLAEAGALDALEVIDMTIRDIGGIHRQSSLIRLKLSTYDKSPVDLSAFPRLESCFLEWRTGADSVFSSSSLRELYINGFPDEDLQRVSSLELLHSLRLGGCRRLLLSLSGVDRLRDLRDLGIYDAWKLTTLAGIDELGGHLTSLRLAVCRKVANLSPIESCRLLRRLDISDMGTIDSLKPLDGLTDLEELYFSGTTNIRDGDLDGIARLPRLRAVGYQNRRHYTHRREQLDDSWS